MRHLQLTPEHVRQLQAIFEGAGIETARHRPVIFGSRTRGVARPYSDVDVGIAGEPLTLGQLDRVVEDLEESDLPFRVEVVNLAGASPEFRQVAEASAVALAEAAGLRP